MKKISPLSIILFAFVLGSCGSYKQNIMFRTDGHQLSKLANTVESNYVIQKNDLLKLEVFSNKAEKILTPTVETPDNATAETPAPTERTYLVNEQGIVKFPMIQEIKLEGLSLRKAEEILQQEYTKFFVEPFVVLSFSNKRTVVLGATGGVVVPLTNENMKLTEVLALSKAITNDAKANNIRVLRGQEVYVVDFSTIEGYLKNDMIIRHGDIVYVEPVRRPFIEGLRDYGALVSIITSLGTLVFVIIQLR